MKLLAIPIPALMLISMLAASGCGSRRVGIGNRNRSGGWNWNRRAFRTEHEEHERSGRPPGQLSGMGSEGQGAPARKLRKSRRLTYPTHSQRTRMSGPAVPVAQNAARVGQTLGYFLPPGMVGPAAEKCFLAYCRSDELPHPMGWASQAHRMVPKW